MLHALSIYPLERILIIFRNLRPRAIVWAMRTIIPVQENPALREMASPIPVAEISSPRIRSLIADMRHLLSQEKHGVAIAASQVGEPLQLFVVSGEALAERDSDDDSKARPKTQPDQVYINPQLIKLSRTKMEKHEGCLSIRGYWGMVPRADKATVVAYDEHGKKFTRGASGFLAHIFQHEIDHLNGILYTDRAKTLYEDSKDDDESDDE